MAARRGRKPAAAKDPNAPVTEKDMEAAELYPKVTEQVNQILASLKDICISEQREDPNWEADPENPDEKPRMVDTDPPTDPLGICRNSATVLASKSVKDAKKYTGRMVKKTGVHSVKEVIVKARGDIQRAYRHLVEAQAQLQLEMETAEEDRKGYIERNREKERDAARRKRQNAAAMVREADRIERDLAG